MKIIVNIKEPLSTKVVDSIATRTSSLESIRISYMGIQGSFEMLSLIQTLGITGQFEIDINGEEHDIEEALIILSEFHLL